MRRLPTGPFAAALLALFTGALLPSTCAAHTYHVYPEATEWDEILQCAGNSAGEGDTVLAAPGTYVVDPYDYWPIVLRNHEECPCFMSESGPEVTIIQGDGTVPAFYIPDISTMDFPNIRIIGFTIRGASSPIEDREMCAICGDVLIKDCIIENNGEGILLYACQNGELSGNIIRNNGRFGVAIAYFKGAFCRNEVTGHSVCGVQAAPSWYQCTFEDNVISGNGSCGLYVNWGPQMRNNIIENNDGLGVGIEQGDTCVLERNIIRGNAVGIEVCDWTALDRANGNDIYDNSEYDFQVHGHSRASPRTFDATGNWWGTTDPAEIAERIYDAADDPSLEITILYDPWCAAPGCDPTGVEPASWGAIKALYR